MIIYQNKQDTSGDNKIIQEQNDLCSGKLQSEKLSGHLQKKRSLIIVKFERAKRAGKKIDDFIAEMIFKVKKLG